MYRCIQRPLQNLNLDSFLSESIPDIMYGTLLYPTRIPGHRRQPGCCTGLFSTDSTSTPRSVSTWLSWRITFFTKFTKHKNYQDASFGVKVESRTLFDGFHFYTKIGIRVGVLTNNYADADFGEKVESVVSVHYRRIHGVLSIMPEINLPKKLSRCRFWSGRWICRAVST